MTRSLSRQTCRESQLLSREAQMLGALNKNIMIVIQREIQGYIESPDGLWCYMGDVLEVGDYLEISAMRVIT